MQLVIRQNRHKCIQFNKIPENLTCSVLKMENSERKKTSQIEMQTDGKGREKGTERGGERELSYNV